MGLSWPLANPPFVSCAIYFPGGIYIYILNLIWGNLYFTHTLVHGSGGRAFLVEHRGDWKWLREAYSLSTHWSAGNHICHICFARGGKSPYRWSRILWLIFEKTLVDPEYQNWEVQGVLVLKLQLYPNCSMHVSRKLMPPKPECTTPLVYDYLPNMFTRWGGRN